MIINNNEYKLLEPWDELADTGETIVQELNKEISNNHILYNKKCQPLARRFDQDDVLFYIKEDDCYAVVHLTWSGKPETNPNWPQTEIYHIIDEFLNIRMKEDNLNY